jgi:hypothetical protein
MKFKFAWQGSRVPKEVTLIESFEQAKEAAANYQAAQQKFAPDKVVRTAKEPYYHPMSDPANWEKS